MRLSDAGLRRRETKLIYPDHPFPPCLTEDAIPRPLEPIVRRCDSLNLPQMRVVQKQSNKQPTRKIALTQLSRYMARGNAELVKRASNDYRRK
jgi:hypothetical protein